MKTTNMGTNLSKTPHIIFFAGFLPALSIFLAWCFSQVFSNPPFWIETLSPLLAYGILYSIFDKYLWNWKVFKWLGISIFPDLRGRWKGNQKSSYQVEGENVIVPSFLEIRQSFSEICICAYYQKSQSASVTASFVETSNGDYLFYTYDSEPNSLKQGTMQIHRGTVKLKCIPNENKMMGVYFNSIGNTGDMDFDFESSKLLDRFI